MEKLRCYMNYRHFKIGDEIIGKNENSFTDDIMNFYWHDVNDDTGWSKSNFMVLPKYAFRKVEPRP